MITPTYYLDLSRDDRQRNKRQFALYDIPVGSKIQAFVGSRQPDYHECHLLNELVLDHHVEIVGAPHVVEAWVRRVRGDDL